MSGSQRKKLEACQRMLLRWIFKRCTDNQLLENDATLFLAKGTEDAANEIDKLLQSENDISYKDRLLKAELYPITSRIDRNLIMLAAESMSDRLRMKHMTKRQKSARLGPFLHILIANEKNRPPYFKAIFEKSLAFASASLFNKLSPVLRNMISSKLAFKEQLSRLSRKIDVLDHNCIPAKSLKIEHQIHFVNLKQFYS